MDLAVLKEFFMWCTVLSGAMLLLIFLVTAFAGGWLYRVQNRWYAMPRSVFTVVLYSFVGLFKIFFLLFNLIPYIALVIMG